MFGMPNVCGVKRSDGNIKHMMGQIRSDEYSDFDRTSIMGPWRLA
jgi:hypothetical protein